MRCSLQSSTHGACEATISVANGDERNQQRIGVLTPVAPITNLRPWPNVMAGGEGRTQGLAICCRVTTR
jgi:hypothetical protein